MTFINSLQDFFQYDFLQFALIGTFILSLICGILSPLLIARKNAFIGSAISHSTLLGLSISLALFESAYNYKVFTTTLLVTLCSTFFLAHASLKEKLPSDSVIGIFYTSTLALGIIIHSLFTKNKSDLLGFLFGNILLLSKEDIFISLILLSITVPFILIPLKKWIFITYDKEGAITSGINYSFYHYLFFILLTLLIVTSIKLAGTILIETELLIPGFFGLMFAKNSKQTFIYSVGFSTIFSILGIILANYFGLPSGGTLAVTLFLALLLSFLLKKFYTLLK